MMSDIDIDTIATVINSTLGALAIATLLPYLDRLRNMNWRSHPPMVVGLHLVVAIMLGGMAFGGLVDQAIVTDIGFADDITALYHLASVVAAAVWLRISSRAWHEGQAGLVRRRSSDYMPLSDEQVCERQ